MIVAVLDTNVLVSGFPAQRGIPAALIDFWRHRAFQLVVSETILTELAETWRAPYWQARFSPEQAADAIALPRADAVVSPLTVTITGVATHARRRYDPRYRRFKQGNLSGYRRPKAARNRRF